MDNYKTAGYGGGKIGFGEQAAVLVVDFQLGFTDPSYPAGKSEHIHSAVLHTNNLLELAREKNIPVANCNVAWSGITDMGYWKVTSLYDGSFFKGHKSTEIDPRVLNEDYDFIFTKSAPSIFFQTPLLTYLIKQRVDTVVITGCTTSGCVRASVVDAFSYGFRVIVPQECCGDQEEQAHKDSLRDVGRRYADVLPTETVMNYFQTISVNL